MSRPARRRGMPRYAAVRVKALEGRPHQIFMDPDTRGHHGSQELAILHFLPGRCFFGPFEHGEGLG